MPFDSHDLPPLPWSYVALDRADGAGIAYVHLLDATGRKIASVWGKGTEKIAMAELICDAADIIKRSMENVSADVQDGKRIEDLGDRAAGGV